MADDPSEAKTRECRFQDDFNPLVVAQNGSSQCLPQPPLKNSASERSENYLASLEAKLRRLKGKTSGKISAKEMIQSLSKIKEDALNRFVSQDSSSMVSMDMTEGSEERTISELKRRMFPEQPLTSEELQCLLERDCLNQVAVTEDISPMHSGGSSS